MHICRLIRKRCNSKSWKKVKNFLYFAKRRNFESITNSPEWSATTSSKGKQAKKLDDFLRRLKCVLNLWKSLWHAFLLLLWKLFNLHSFFFLRLRVLHWTKHWQLNLLLKNLSRKSVRVSGAELENNFNHNTSGFWNKVWSMSNFTYMPDWLLIAQCGGPGTLSWASLESSPPQK